MKSYNYKDCICYYENGEYHRIDGPAIIYNNGDKEYFIKGKQYKSKKAFKKAVKRYNKKILNEKEKEKVMNVYELGFHSGGSKRKVVARDSKQARRFLARSKSKSKNWLDSDKTYCKKVGETNGNYKEVVEV